MFASALAAPSAATSAVFQALAPGDHVVAPLDAYFEELQELWSHASAPTCEEELALMQRHGMEPAKVGSK